MATLILLAQIYHPWCWQPSDGYGQIYCGYGSNFECMASNKGREGYCRPTGGGSREDDEAEPVLGDGRFKSLE